MKNLAEALLTTRRYEDPIVLVFSGCSSNFQLLAQRVLAHGRPAVIVKVNPKTLRVMFDLEWMNALNITKVPMRLWAPECKEVA